MRLVSITYISCPANQARRVPRTRALEVNRLITGISPNRMMAAAPNSNSPYLKLAKAMKASNI